jgi:hypothetical protein
MRGMIYLLAASIALIGAGAESACAEDEGQKAYEAQLYKYHTASVTRLATTHETPGKVKKKLDNAIVSARERIDSFNPTMQEWRGMLEYVVLPDGNCLVTITSRSKHQRKSQIVDRKLSGGEKAMEKVFNWVAKKKGWGKVDLITYYKGTVEGRFPLADAVMAMPQRKRVVFSGLLDGVWEAEWMKRKSTIPVQFSQIRMDDEYYDSLEEIFGERIEKARKEVEKKPDSAKAHNALGNILKEAELYAEALEQYEKAVELHPDYGTPYKNLGVVHVLDGEFETGKEILVKSLSVEGEKKLSSDQKAEARFFLGMACFNLEQYEEATEFFKRSAKKDEYKEAAEDYLAQMP